MASLTYQTTADEDAIIVWELARRAKSSATPPKSGQDLLGIEFGHVLRAWQADRKGEVLAKVQNDPANLTVPDKAILGIK